MPHISPRHISRTDAWKSPCVTRSAAYPSLCSPTNSADDPPFCAGRWHDTPWLVSSLATLSASSHCGAKATTSRRRPAASSYPWHKGRGAGRPEVMRGRRAGHALKPTISGVHDMPVSRRGRVTVAESARGISPRAAHRTVREPLDSHGSCHPWRAAASRS